MSDLDERLASPITKEVIYWRGRRMEVAPRRIHVKFRSPAVGDVRPALEALGASELPETDTRSAVIVVPPGADLARELDRFAENSNVLTAEPDAIHRAFLTPGDPKFQAQWCHATIGSTAAWDEGVGSNAVLLGIIDSGISLDDHSKLTHPDMNDAARFHLGTDFVDRGRSPRDVTGHGTGMTGLAAAVGNNGVGFAGMNWRSPVHICRVLNRINEGSVSALRDAVREIVAKGRESGKKIVINYSAGGDDELDSVADAVALANDPDVLICCAAGSSSSKPIAYHAHLSNRIAGIIAVGATRRDDSVAGSSARGPNLTLVAPGVDILAPLPTYQLPHTPLGETEDTVTGTSGATALVSGLASLVWSLRPLLTNVQVKGILTRSAHKLEPGILRDDKWGFGRINAAGAIQLARAQ